MFNVTDDAVPPRSEFHRGVRDDPGPAYQLRRYGWTDELPLSIVTDSERR